MSDEPLSPDHELANAYLDGHADAAERARVEASPELLALVASYQALRTRVADVPPPSAASREAAIAAALAAVPLVAPPLNVVSLERRRWSKALTAAAAVMLLGVAGVAVSKAVTGSDGNSSTAEPASQNVAGSNKAGAPGATDARTEGDAATLVGPDTTVAGAPNVAGGAIGGGGDTSIPPQISTIGGGASGVQAFSEPEQLRTLPEPTAPVVPNFVFDCALASTQEIVAEITWRNTSAVAVRDTVSGVITVLSPDCTELISVPPQP